VTDKYQVSDFLTRFYVASGDSKHVRAVSAEEAESMYMALCERTNDQHVLLIIYTPGCQQCKQMESEVCANPRTKCDLVPPVSHSRVSCPTGLSCTLILRPNHIARSLGIQVLQLTIQQAGAHVRSICPHTPLTPRFAQKRHSARQAGVHVSYHCASAGRAPRKRPLPH